MISYYDSIGQQIIATAEPPRGYTIDIVEKDTFPGMVYLRIYAIEIHAKSDNATQLLADWLKLILNKLNDSLSIGKYTYEISTSTPGEFK